MKKAYEKRVQFTLICKNLLVLYFILLKIVTKKKSHTFNNLKPFDFYGAQEHYKFKASFRTSGNVSKTVKNLFSWTCYN